MLQLWFYPQNANYCDQEVDIRLVSANIVYRIKVWDFPLPISTAINWNCKYRIRMDTTFVENRKLNNKGRPGFIVV